MGLYDVYGAPARLGTLAWSDGTRRVLDWPDVLWLARALTAENDLGWSSSPLYALTPGALREDYIHKAAVCWMLAQRKYAMPAFRRMSYEDFVRQWSGPLHSSHAKFPMLSTASWGPDGAPVKQLPLDARKVALDWAMGQLPNFVPGVIDSGTLVRAAGGPCQASTSGSTLLKAPYRYATIVGRAGCNGFFAFGPGYGTVRWSGHEVYVETPSGGARSAVGGWNTQTRDVYRKVLTWRARPVGSSYRFADIPNWA